MHEIDRTEVETLRATIALITLRKKGAMNTPQPEAPQDEPLPATLTFVLMLGGLLLVGWLAMFFLLLHRWG